MYCLYAQPVTACSADEQITTSQCAGIQYIVLLHLLCIKISDNGRLATDTRQAAHNHQ